MEISENSRIWVYQANRLLTPSEQTEIQGLLDLFTAQWQAHGHRLAAKGEIRFDQFIILSVDESVAGATGCSIDKSVYLMKELEEKFRISLFDRFRIAYRRNDEVINCSREEFSELLSEGVLNEDTLVFNNMIGTRADLSSKWEVPLKQSWHAQVFAGQLQAGRAKRQSA